MILVLPVCASRSAGQVRRQIMEQDEVHHRVMDEARRKITAGGGGLGKDGRGGDAGAARKQRQTLQAEQVRNGNNNRAHRRGSTTRHAAGTVDWYRTPGQSRNLYSIHECCLLTR